MYVKMLPIFRASLCALDFISNPDMYLMMALFCWCNLQFKKTAVTKVRDQVGGKGVAAIPHMLRGCRW